MNRNKQEKQKKEILRLIREGNEIWDAIGRQKWFELDEPYQNGWEAEFVVREDLSRSKYNDELQYLIEEFGRTVWSKNKDFVEKYGKRKSKVIEPYFRKIYEREYNELHPVIQKYFSVDVTGKSYWYGKRYYCNVEHWKLDIKKSKHIVTHYREHDEILYQMLAENQAELDKYYGKVYPNYSGKGYWNKQQRKREKGITKRKLSEIKKGYNAKDNDIDYWNHEYDGYKLDVFPNEKATDWWYWY